ncbi:MAG: BatA domain-containing protein [Thermomicrobiales bacterium]
MNILAPLGLAALIGIPLIVIFHMRHFTPFERHVPTLRFWREIEPARTDDVRFRRPPVTMLLVLQLVAAGLLGLALARPAVSGAWAGISQQTTMRHLVVILDGSSSMSATDSEDGHSRFDAARASALSHIDDLREGDVATTIVLGTQVNTLQGNDGAEIDRLADALQAMPAPGGIADLNAALKLVADLDLPGVREEILVLTDGALSVDPTIVEELNATVTLETFGDPRSSNLAITEISSRASADNLARSSLLVQVANFSDAPATTTLLAVADGFEAFRQDVAIDANSATDVIIDTLPVDASNVVIEVRSTDPLFADNQIRMPLSQQSDFALRMLLVSDNSSHLQRALASLPGATVVTVTSTENLRGAIPAGPYDLVVYDGASPAEGAIPDSPLLIVNPPRDGVIPMSGMVTAPTIERIRANDPILRGVDLSGLTFFQNPIHDLDGSAIEIAGAAEGPLLYRADVPGRDQRMIVLAVDLEQSNLPQRIAFPILIANIVAELSPNPLPATVRLGDPVTYTPHAGAASVRVVNPSGEAIELTVAESESSQGEAVLSREITFSATGTPGVYQLTELNESGQTIAAATFVVNAGHPQESDLRAEAGLPEALSVATASGEQTGQRLLSDLWPALAALAFVVLVTEWLWTNLPVRNRLPRLRSRVVRDRTEVADA